ncbi:MAG: 23S rRNA (pseudouridine(1915)-N(3))-methyltransferase RlmH [Arenicellales bacterium]|nr:23S rRNA (pseudouridine(1915)-N(3))-methyltransferase RlmH [Arenicellales bacterium]
MRLIMTAVGRRLPDWVSQGVATYAGRFGGGVTLELTEVEAPRRGRNVDIAGIVRTEGKLLLQAVPRGSHLVALDERGTQHDSDSAAARLEAWMADGRDVALLIGGADGLAGEVFDAAQECWSLSALTLAHPLVRVVLAEQLYRAYSILKGLPYHRGARMFGP